MAENKPQPFDTITRSESMSDEIRVSASNAIGTTTGVKRGVDVDVIVTLDGKQHEGEVTLIPGEDSRHPGYTSWGGPDNWITGELLERLHQLPEGTFEDVLIEMSVTAGEVADKFVATLPEYARFRVCEDCDADGSGPQWEELELGAGEDTTLGQALSLALARVDPKNYFGRHDEDRSNYTVRVRVEELDEDGDVVQAASAETTVSWPF